MEKQICQSTPKAGRTRKKRYVGALIALGAIAFTVDPAWEQTVVLYHVRGHRY